MSSMLKPWFAIAIPHQDIREGRLSEASFAADLWAVIREHKDEDQNVLAYRDPEAFFAKTYMTAGLTNVLKKAAHALAGESDAGDRIVSLQTSFGGGKTHALVALWHLARHGDTIRRAAACAEVRQALGAALPERVKAVAVFTHQTCDAVQGRHTPEGVHTRTLWGELALQLGGVELYRAVEANDQARTVPQGLFADILRRAAPCLILLDELADYCVGASAVEVGQTTLADQTISFAQQLTQAVQNVPGVALVATLPASHLEVASSERGQEILTSLESRFGRMSADVKPVADEEIYQVVRRRLFETVGDPAEHERVAGAYGQMYGQHKNEVPVEATRGTYRERIAAAYPFHPTLIDALYLRWGSHSGFQRTRGVLRLLACIVGDLWQRRHTETQSQPLIQPCHVRWTLDPLHAALTRLWGVAYESVVAADVVGDKANAPSLDQERGGDYTTEKIAQGLAAAILLGSFGGQGERAGYSTRDLKLAVERPGLNWGYVDGALLALEEDRAFYLHATAAGDSGKRYWFGTRPTLTKLLVQYRSQFAAQGFDAEIVEALEVQVRGLTGGRSVRDRGGQELPWRVVVNPSPDLPEQKALALLVMPPDCAYADDGGSASAAVERRLLAISLKCGTRDRLYRNTLLFLLPSSRGLGRLRGALREVAALETVSRDYGSQLDAEQKNDLDKRLEAARKSVSEALGSAYAYAARIEGQGVAVVQVADPKPSFGDHLQAVWKQLVEEEEWVLRKVGAVTLQKVGLVLAEGGMRIQDAVEAFLRYTDKPMIATREAVLQGLAQACQEKLIGIGRGVNLGNLQRRWCGEAVTLDPGEEGLWILPPFELKPETPPVAPTDSGAGAPPSPGPVATGTTPVVQPTDETATGVTPQPGKQVRRFTVKGSVPLESWADIFRSFVNPAARMNLKRLRLGIDFEMEAQDGQPLDENNPALKAMVESARQLGLDLEEQS